MNIEQSLTRGLCGDLEVVDSAAPDLSFLDEIPSDHPRIRIADQVIAVIQRDVDVEAVSRRLGASGLLLYQDASAPLLILGVDSKMEPKVLPRFAVGLAESLGGGGRALIGESLARRLGIQLGERFTALIPTDNGLFEGDDFQVAGFFSPSGVPLVDEFAVVMSIGDLETLLGPDTGPTSLVVRLTSGADAIRATRRIQAALNQNGFSVRVRGWRERAGKISQIVQVGQMGMRWALVLLTFILGLVVLNTVVLLVLERSGEISTMRALGSSRLRVVRILMVEAALVHTFAAVAGSVAGAALCWALGRNGIPVGSKAMMYALGGNRLFLRPTFEDLVIGFVLVVSVGLLATFVPAVVVTYRTALVDGDRR
ncbi:MAG: FtsX-like permease family protein [Acidobacteriota bacterium]|nr:FtsX-like permease family protein [Acidobacteriota bacterium]